MITTSSRHQCPYCRSEQISRARKAPGRTRTRKQKYHYRECNAYGTLEPTVAYSPERKAEILRAYDECSSLRGLERSFGVARQTVAKWLREEDAQLPALPPREAAQPEDILELDERWSFVGSKKDGGSG